MNNQSNTPDRLIYFSFHAHAKSQQSEMRYQFWNLIKTKNPRDPPLERSTCVCYKQCRIRAVPVSDLHILTSPFNTRRVWGDREKYRQIFALLRGTREFSNRNGLQFLGTVKKKQTAKLSKCT